MALSKILPSLKRPFLIPLTNVCYSIIRRRTSTKSMIKDLEVLQCCDKGESVRREMCLSKLNEEMSCNRLSLRDLKMFVRSTTNYPSLPVILSRKSYSCYLLNVPYVTLICNESKVVVANPDAVVVQTLVHDIQESINQNNNDNDTKNSKEEHYNNTCFELLVLDRSLGAVNSKLRRHLRLLVPVLELLLRETSANPSSDMLLRLLAFRKALNAFESRVTTTRAAVKEVLNNREDLRGLLLGDSIQAEMELEFVLESHENDLRHLELDLHSMQEQIDDTNDFINTHLNATRNGIIRLSLLMDMGTLAVGSGAVVAGLFGMNLVSGLEHSQFAFFYVTFGILVTIVVLFRVFVRNLNRLRADTTQARTLQALRHFLGYVEHLDDLMQAQRKGQVTIDRERFTKLLGPAMGLRVGEEDLENIFRILDGNRDGKLDWKDQ